jgi:hypothetical protein
MEFVFWFEFDEMRWDDGMLDVVVIKQIPYYIRFHGFVGWHEGTCMDVVV